MRKDQPNMLIQECQILHINGVTSVTLIESIYLVFGSCQYITVHFTNSFSPKTVQSREQFRQQSDELPMEIEKCFFY